MKKLRFAWLATVLAGSAVTVQTLNACGSDPSPHSQPGDAGRRPDVGTPVAPLPDSGVSQSREKIYLGQTARIDAREVAGDLTDATIAWSLVTAPPGSTAALQGADSVRSFEPDRLGEYVLELLVTKKDFLTRAVVSIEVLDPPVFWNDITMTGSLEDAGVAIDTVVGGADTDGGHAVACGFQQGSIHRTSAGNAVVGGRYSASTADVWEAPAGTPSRIAFGALHIADGGTGASFFLTGATSASTCGSPDSKVLDAVTEGTNVARIVTIRGIRFSPNGERIGYLRTDRGRIATINTIGFDGSARRTLSASGSGADGGIDPDASVEDLASATSPILPPRWKDASHVGWVAFFGPDATKDERPDWEIHVVEDRDDASESLYMRCTGLPLHGFDFLPNGDVLVSARHPIGGGQSPVDLLVLRPNPTTSRCEEIRNLTNNTTTDRVSRDLALSPDKTRVAFFHGTGTGTAIAASGTLFLATVPVDGSGGPALVPGADDLPADPGVGPRWIAGGTRLTWGQVRDQDAAAPLGTGQISTVNVMGGTVRVVAQGEVSSNTPSNYGIRLAYGIGQGCGVATARIPALVGYGAGAALAALLGRRRLRRKR